MLERTLIPVLLSVLLAFAALPAPADERPCILLITVDDMDWDSVGAYGCPIKEITPNIDRLAAEGLRFLHAHVNCAVCQPCRESLMTGRYPIRAGAVGFAPIRDDVPTLAERLREAGYQLGILGKVPHLKPAAKFPWHFVRNAAQLGRGRDPDRYHRHASAFFATVRAANQPFFLMANTHDPHRPFAGSDQEQRQWGTGGRRGGRERPAAPLPAVRRRIRPEEVVVPPFLEDLPAVRRELAEYFTSVHRADESVGAVLRALAESGLADRTVVMLLSDNGMALPFAKTNCYRHSTRMPWIVRWPGRVEAGRVDRDHLVSGIDFLPTVLEILGLEPLPGVDGRSFLELLRGGRQAGREFVFTHFDRTSGRRDYPMRAVHDRRYGYIANFWADGTTVFRNESQNGRTMQAMRAAAQEDEAVAARVRLFLHRVPEELYDYETDPGARRNLVDDPAQRERLADLRRRLLEHLESTGDPHLAALQRLAGIAENR